MSSCDDSPLQVKDVFSCDLGLSSEVQGVQEERTPDATGNPTHANAFLKRRTKNDCGNVSFLFFVASTPTNVWFLALPARFLLWTLLKQQLPIVSVARCGLFDCPFSAKCRAGQLWVDAFNLSPEPGHVQVHFWHSQTETKFHYQS